MKPDLRRRALVFSLLVVLALAMPRRASAEGTVETAPIVLGAFGALDIGLGAADLVAAARGKRHSAEYALVETLLGGVQTVVCLEGAQDTRAINGPRAYWWVGAGLGGALLAYGLFTMFAPRPQAEPGPVTVAPLALSDAARAPAPGVAVLGRF